MNLRKFSNLVKKTTRLLYTNPLVPVIIDFIIDHKFAEAFTLSHKLKIEDKKREI